MISKERWPSGRRRSPAKGVWGVESHRGFESLSLRKFSRIAPVAQLDRVSGYELEGREFESLRAHQTIKKGALAPFFYNRIKIDILPILSTSLELISFFMSKVISLIDCNNAADARI